ETDAESFNNADPSGAATAEIINSGTATMSLFASAVGTDGDASAWAIGSTVASMYAASDFDNATARLDNSGTLGVTGTANANAGDGDARAIVDLNTVVWQQADTNNPANADGIVELTNGGLIYASAIANAVAAGAGTNDFAEASAVVGGIFGDAFIYQRATGSLVSLANS